MIVKVLFENGICSGVYMDEEAQKQKIQVTVIDADSNLGTDNEVVEDEIRGLRSVHYELTHCEGEYDEYEE